MVKFTKMEGLGNDFVVLNAVNQHFQLTEKLIEKWGNRKTGIGFDQLLCLEKSPVPNADFLYRIFNRDGTEVEMCGNGARCIAKFILANLQFTKEIIKLTTLSGIITMRVLNDKEIEVEMGEPIFEFSKIPFNPPTKITEIASNSEFAMHEIEILGILHSFGIVRIGAPHAVTFVDHVDEFDVDGVGSEVEKHYFFPQRINVTFVEILNKSEIKVRVYERGAKETLACGTGACAAAVISMMTNKVENSITVHAIGGDLKVFWKGLGNSVFKSGPANFVYSGEIDLQK